MSTSEKQPRILTDKQRSIRALAQVLWQVSLGADMPADKEQRKADWKEHRSSHIKTARALVTRMEKRGFTIAAPTR